MSRMSKFAALAGAAVLGLMAGVAQAQTNWPQRPITFVVSNGAGSSPDVMARLLGAQARIAGRPSAPSSRSSMTEKPRTAMSIVWSPTTRIGSAPATSPAAAQSFELRLLLVNERDHRQRVRIERQRGPKSAA